MTPLKVLVTAGATEVPIDRVRAITNIFKGRTGTEIAVAFEMLGWRERRGGCHHVTLLTSNPRLATEHMEQHQDAGSWGGPDIRVLSYRTFDELAGLLEQEVRGGRPESQNPFRPVPGGPYDVIIHSAAVSDYRVAGVHMRGDDGGLVPLDASGKVGSSHEHLFLDLERTPKLLEQIRGPWGFTGKLIQFKLEVGITDEELITRARAALVRSQGDLVVANCLEWSRDAALLIDRNGLVERVDRARLPDALVRRFT